MIFNSVNVNITIKMKLCSGCGNCIVTCPTKALKASIKEINVTSDCNNCLECLEVCPTGAILNESK